jgi:hypothetical protein
VIAPQNIKRRAERLVREHFESLNAHDLESAKGQLFWPDGTSENPIDVYLATMSQLTPFEVISSTATGFEDVREKRHGPVATIPVRVSVKCSLGDRSTEMIVWWRPEGDRLEISSRPSEWVIEQRRRSHPETGKRTV